MKIGINGFEAIMSRFGFNKTTGFPNRVGSSEYCFKLLESLYNHDKKNNYQIYLPKDPTSDLPKECDRWNYKIVKKRSLWTMFDLSVKFFLKNERLDVFFSPTHYLPFYLPFPSVISIMDLSYVFYPELFKKKDLFQLRLWTSLSIKKAKKIITISKSSKNDIIKYYKIPESKVSVIYPGIKQKLEDLKLNMEEIKNKYNLKEDYILFVGTLQPRKNLDRLIEAFSRIKDEKLELVIIGKKGWMYKDILKAPKKFGVEDKVKFLDFVPDDELAEIYKYALCFVFPSLYEGFGLPVLEAMKYGCPVVASNVSSIPEAGGDAAVYFDPYKIDDIVDKIEKMVSNSDLRKKMIEKGYEQIKKFSWEKAAKETLAVLEGVVNK